MEVKLTEVLTALTNKEKVFAANDADYDDYFAAIMPEFSGEDMRGALNGAVTWFYIQALTKQTDFLIMETFARGIEFGRELERIANSRL